MTVFGFQWITSEVIMTLTILAIFGFAIFIILPLFYWRRRGVPSAFAIPFLGSVSQAALLKKSIGEVYTEIYNNWRGKRYVGFHNLVKPALLMRDTELIKNVLNRDFDHFQRNDVHIETSVDPLFAKHIFSLYGEWWKRLRATLSPGYSSGKMKAIYPLVTEISNNLRSYLTECIESSGDKGYAADMKDICGRFTIDSVASIAFGLQCNAIRNPNTEFRKMGKKILEPSPSKAIAILVILQAPWLNKIFRIPFIPTEVANFFRNIVLNVITKREDEGIERSDYIQFFTQLWREGKLKKDGKPTSNSKVSVHTLKDNIDELDDITAQSVGIFADGYETSSILISFILFELAHNQEVQRKLRQDIQDVVNQNGGNLTYEALQSIPYMEMVIKETLRIHPPAPFTSRICTKRYLLPNPDEDVSEGGIWLEEGMSVIFPVYALQHDPQFFSDPENFDPERFSSEGKRNRPSCAYMPFGDGPRMCIGMRFALLQTKIAVASIIMNFQLLPHEKTTKPIIQDPNYFLAASKNGLWTYMKLLKS